MLHDSERKLFRVIYNYYAQNRQMPDYSFLQRSTGKSKEQISVTLNNLSDQSYVEWDKTNPESIHMLKQPDTKKEAQKVDGSKYFNEH